MRSCEFCGSKTLKEKRLFARLWRVTCVACRAAWKVDKLANAIIETFKPRPPLVVTVLA